MAALVKAKLADPKDIKGTEFSVQLNPTSLRLQMSNSVDRGKGVGRPDERFQGESATTLSMDLVFDTADEGKTGAPVSVRTKTAKVRQFVIPDKKNGKQSPPGVRFAWGDLIVEGVMTGLTEDVDLFSPEGVPLRAKLSVTISAQNPEFANLASGSGANQGANATAPGGGAGRPGMGGGLGLGASASAGLSLGGGGIGFGGEAGAGIGVGGSIGGAVGFGGSAGLTGRTELAMGGESAAEFAARVGVDPAAWRGLAGAMESSMSLQAGTQVDFSTDLSISAGVGTTLGFEVGAGASLEVGLGLEVGASASAGVGGSAAAGAGAALQAGFALAAAGGIAAAAATAASTRASQAADGARQAFAIPAPASTLTAAPAAYGSGGAPSARAITPAGPGIRQGADATVRVPAAGSPTAAPMLAVTRPRPVADQRASSFGQGVPLRPQVHWAAGERAALVHGAPRLSSPLVPSGLTTSDPSVPPWIALPARDAGRRESDSVQGIRRPLNCGCGGRSRREATCPVCRGA